MLSSNSFKKLQNSTYDLPTLGSTDRSIFQYEKPPFNMTAYAQNKTEKTLQNDDRKVVKILSSLRW